ncbi:sensor histidine kinase [Arcticibacterium luteifluviistationis]|uniref:histidine kinase n=1 Tax=Arcticibacterium luteifluviistationis TaxID=1784714 RepID=A0A2Z4GCU0_9BACT|nr:ATP-binding protein [Arcticibacterium luteifluviistationis]AWV98937.1 two-component sensor histidine kinase [Arcticibacterium luteifluviistationis]
MKLSPRWIAFLLAGIVSSITMLFLSFIPECTTNILFVAGAGSFLTAFFTAYVMLDILLLKEVKQIYDTLQKLKIGDLDIKKKSVFKSFNPFNKLNNEISDYVNAKQIEIDELKRMESFRREFLADVSHELKTPIFAAQGFVHTLLDGAKDDPSVAKRFLKKAAKSLDGLDALVRDLVVLTQVETGDIKMNFEIVDIVSITEDIFEQLENKADKRGIHLKIRPKAIKECAVVADAQRIYQVLTNFIDNGIKYGKENGKVSVEFEEFEEHFLITVEDDGPGIPKDHLARIFERFYRVDKSRSRETGGTGLGLAIVKHILNAHKSSINVTSTPETGTRFSFTLSKGI